MHLKITVALLAVLCLCAIDGACQDTSVPVAPPSRIAGGVIAGSILTKVNPVYPAEAKAQGIEGTVVLHAIIARDGTIESLKPVSGNEVLAAAAVDAVKQWTYRPYLLNGEPTEVDTTITVNFSMGRSTPPQGGIATMAPAGTAPGNGPVKVSGGVMAGMLLHRTMLAYPREAKVERIQGSVVLRAIIGKDGRVKNLQVMSGHPTLTQAAIDAVKDWVYRPYLLNGDPVEVETTVTCNFSFSG